MLKLQGKLKFFNFKICLVSLHIFSIFSVMKYAKFCKMSCLLKMQRLESLNVKKVLFPLYFSMYVTPNVYYHRQLENHINH
jgi:hypothetical protein